jgi:hypothetical protein
MSALIKRLLWMSSLVLLAGCTVSLPQLSALRAAIATAPTEQYDAYEWVVSYGNRQVPVYAISGSGQIVFADANNVLVTFDGWRIRQASGLIEGDQFNVRSYGDDRIVVTNRFQTLDLECSNWVVRAADDQSASVWENPCVDRWTGRVYTNSIVVDASGQISEIRQVIDPDGKYVKVTKRKNTDNSG